MCISNNFRWHWSSTPRWLRETWSRPDMRLQWRRPLRILWRENEVMFQNVSKLYWRGVSVSTNLGDFQCKQCRLVVQDRKPCPKVHLWKLWVFGRDQTKWCHQMSRVWVRPYSNSSYRGPCEASQQNRYRILFKMRSKKPMQYQALRWCPGFVNWWPCNANLWGNLSFECQIWA